MSAAFANPSELREFCLSLPKIELHAHLTGSISQDILHKIWLMRKEKDPGLNLADPAISLKDIWRSMSFFPLFTKYIYRLVNNVDAVFFSTTEVLKSFEADGVAHFELRTTPRGFEGSMTKDDYVRTVLSAISKFNETSQTMKTYLILSMDRRNTPEQAMEAVNLAIKYMDKGVVGVDICGDYKVGDMAMFRDGFAKAKQAGLHITIHFGEMACNIPELNTLLSYEPERIGHVIFITESIKRKIIRRKLGLEICLSGNIMGLKVPSIKDHHLREWLLEDCPIALCTDDVGIIESASSNEYYLAAEHLGLTFQRLWEIALGGVDRCFITDAGKDALRRTLIEWRASEGRRWIK